MVTYCMSHCPPLTLVYVVMYRPRGDMELLRSKFTSVEGRRFLFACVQCYCIKMLFARSYRSIPARLLYSKYCYQISGDHAAVSEQLIWTKKQYRPKDKRTVKPTA